MTRTTRPISWVNAARKDFGPDLWVVHAFQKKSTQGIKTPKHEIDLVAARVKRLKEMFR